MGIRTVIMIVALIVLVLVAFAIGGMKPKGGDGDGK